MCDLYSDMIRPFCIYTLNFIKRPNNSYTCEYNDDVDKLRTRCICEISKLDIRNKDAYLLS